MAMRGRRTKVGRACERCRRQKLRCDIQRPCTLCVHAGSECRTGSDDQFKAFQAPRQDAPRKRSRRQSALDARRKSQSGENVVEKSFSSSTISLIEGAFELHSSLRPDRSMTTAIPGGQDSQTLQATADIDALGRQHRLDRSSWVNPLLQQSRAATTELFSLLPSREVAALLVDTYFDRVHWFMLIFHQEEFRKKWPTFYDNPSESMAAANHNPGLISTFLVVIAIALQYTGEYRQKMLEMHNANSTAIKEGIFSAIRSRLLDIVSFSSIEAVQTCVLLGTYYLYHGSPNLAWPVCGCGLRVAQALKLHRKLPTTEPTSLALQQEIETRKRCWWAIYEIETFCSISYGYPHGIVDADCNVELLDPLATYTCQSPASYNEMHQCPATLLSYKYLMSKLSVFLKEVLTDLYGIGLNKTGSWERQSFKLDSKRLLRKVAILDDRLDKWKAEIPDILCLSQVNRANYSSPEEMDRDIGASGPGFESHIYQLQALALAFAYENARILVHRPLMTYRTKLCQDPASGISPDTFKDTFQMSLQTCRNAAMSTSHIGTSPVFCLAAETYAAAFISIHTFTAGVMLCVLASIELFTPESQECKIGLRRILNMQGQLQSKSRSALSAQGLEILQRLTRLVMERELTEMLGSKTEASAQDKQPELQPSEDWNNSVEDQPDAQLGQGTEIFYGDSMPDIVENTDISQALFDLDQVLSGHDPNVPLQPCFTESNGPNNTFMQEQAWIWGVENPMQFSG